MPKKQFGKLINKSASCARNTVLCCHICVRPAGGISERKAGLSMTCGLLAAGGAYTTWSIDAVSTKHRKSPRPRQTACHFADFHTRGTRRSVRLVALGAARLHLPAFLFIFISAFHLPPLCPPPMLLSLFLSLYLNITPYLAGVASRHSNRTVQSPWGLWDIVSC